MKNIFADYWEIVYWCSAVGVSIADNILKILHIRYYVKTCIQYIKK